MAEIQSHEPPNLQGRGKYNMTAKDFSKIWKGFLYALLGSIATAVGYVPITIVIVFILGVLLFWGDVYMAINNADMFFYANSFVIKIAIGLGLLGGLGGAKRFGSRSPFLGAIIGGVIVAFVSSLLINGLFIGYQKSEDIFSGRFERALETRDTALQSVPVFSGTFEELGSINDYVYNFDLSPDGKTLAYSLPGQAMRCDIALNLQDCIPLSGLLDLSHPKFSQDGRWLAAIESQKNIIIWSVTNGEQVYSFPGNDYAFSQDGNMLASLDFGNIILWDLTTGKEIAQLETPKYIDSCMEFSPNNRVFAACGGGYGQDQFVAVWDINKGELISKIKLPNRIDDYIVDMTFSPNSQLLAAATRWDLTVFDLEALQTISKIEKIFMVSFEIDFSPDGRWIASSGGDRMVYIWDIVTQQPAGKLVSPLPDANHFEFEEFLPDGRMLVVYRNHDQSWSSTIGIITLETP